MNKLIIILSILLSGCAAKTPVTPKRPGPEIIITGDPVDRYMKYIIIKNTEESCQQKYSTSVTRITINYNNKTNYASVKYICESTNG